MMYVIRNVICTLRKGLTSEIHIAVEDREKITFVTV